MNQRTLFELEAAAVEAVGAACLESETDRDRVSRMPDNRRVRRLATIVQQLAGTNDPLDRTKLATQARDLAEALVEETILSANRAGHTWRDIGASLGVPFQTLYRRYGANR